MIGEQLTVQESIDGKCIIISGTKHPLDMVQVLIRTLLDDPQDQQIRATNPQSGIDIIIKLLP